MAMIYVRKLVNAFITDAVVSGVIGGQARAQVNAIQSLMGGLWVGGTVTVTADALDFVPNILNKAFHDKLQSIHIPLAQMRSVRRQFGVLTGIVVCDMDGYEFRFRCFNARGVAQQMADLLPRHAKTA